MTERRIYDNKYLGDTGGNGGGSSMHGHTSSLGRGSNLLAASKVPSDLKTYGKIKLQVGGGNMNRKVVNPNSQAQISRNDNSHHNKSSLMGDSYNQSDNLQYPGIQSLNKVNNYSSRATSGGVLLNAMNQPLASNNSRNGNQSSNEGSKKPRRLRKNFDLLVQALKNSNTAKKEKKINFSQDSRAYNNTGVLPSNVYQLTNIKEGEQPSVMSGQQNQDSIAQAYQYGQSFSRQQPFGDRKSSVYDVMSQPLHNQSYSQRVPSHHSNNSNTHHNLSLFSQISIKDNSQTPQKGPASYTNSRNPSMMIYQNLPNSTQPIVVNDQKQYIKVNDKLMKRYLLNDTTQQVLQPLGTNSQAILNINTASDINIYNNSFIVNTSSKKHSQSQNQSRSSSLKRNQQLPSTGGLNISNQKLKQYAMAQRLVSNQTDRVNLTNILGAQASQNEYSGKFVNMKPNSSQARINNQITKHGSNPRNQLVQYQKFNQIAEAYSTQSFFSQTGGQAQQQSNQVVGMLIGQRNSQNNKTHSSKSLQKQSYTQSFDAQPFNSSQEHDLISSGGSFTKHNTSFQKFKFNNSQNVSKRQRSIRNEEPDFSPQITQDNGQKKKAMSQTLLNQGKTKLLQKDYQSAINLFQETLKFDPTNIDAKFFQALSLLDSGQFLEAIQEFTQILQLSSDQQLNAKVHILLSIAHKRNNHINEAIEILTKCIKKYPQYPDAYLARGQALIIQEKHDQALKDFSQYTQLMPNHGIGYVGTGDSYKALYNWNEAINHYTKALQLFKQTKASDEQTQQHITSTLLKRGLSYYHAKMNKKALADLQQVITFDHNQYKAHFYIGKLLTRQYSETPRITSKASEGQKLQNEAILHFEQVVKYQLNEVYSGNALFEIAKLRLKDKDFYEAYFNLKRAIDSNFNSKRLQLYKDFTEGVLYLIKRKIKKGVQILSDLLEVLVNTKDKKDKKQFDYLKFQGYIYRAYGYVAIEKYELALQDIQRAKKISKLDLPTIYNKLLGKGILKMDNEDYLMATKYFNKASTKFPYNKDAYCLYIISIVRSYSYSMADMTIDSEDKREKVMSAKKYMDHAIANCNKVRVPSLFFFRGLLYFQLHMFYEALKDFNVAIEEEEEPTASYYLARGRCYACLSILNEAMKDLSIALNLDETMQDAYIYRGKCAYLLGDNNLAFLDFQRLILTDPKNPMVHVYAGNLLMTTGAYHDAIKAFSNADTVQHTAVAAFQRARCYCALSDLENAKMQFKIALDLIKNEALVKADSQCLSALIKAIGSLSKQEGREKSLDDAVQIINSLIEYFRSDDIKKLHKKDAKLNIQIIPNVKRIKVEKAAVAKEIISQQNEQKDISISIDMNQTVDLDALDSIPTFSYYYENVFQLEDFYLFRAIFSFYKQDYHQAIDDYEMCSNLKQKEGSHKGMKKQGGGDVSPTNNYHHQEHMNMFSQSSTPVSANSTKTDLSDVGLCSINVYETNFNILLCYLMTKDYDKAVQKLNEIISFAPKKYSKHFYLIRGVVFEELGQREKSKKDLEKFEKADPKGYAQYFQEKKDLQFEPFPIKTRLCSKFENVKIYLNKKGPAIITKPSFSMPFIKPPNMIPNIDEEAIQGEFTLKQIDAPMPEAPWIRRCEHGIKFTDNILQDEDEENEEDLGQSVDPNIKHGSVPNAPLKGNQSKKKAQIADESPYIHSIDVNNPQQRVPNQKGISERILQNTTVYFVDNEEEEHLSDKHKISLFDDSKFEDYTIDHNRNSYNQSISKPLGSIVRRGESIDHGDDLLQQDLLRDSKDSDDEAEGDEDDSSDDQDLAASLQQEQVIFDRDSMVLMGDSVLKGAKKKKIVL